MVQIHVIILVSQGYLAMLKMTKIELEIINDPDKYMFFEQGMRRGVSYIYKRNSKANNKYCPDYDKTKPEI